MNLEIADLETLDRLRKYIEENLHGSTVLLDTNGEVIIRTGMGIDMGNYLYPLSELNGEDE
jgi:hypothetical protein